MMIVPVMAARNLDRQDLFANKLMTFPNASVRICYPLTRLLFWIQTHPALHLVRQSQLRQCQWQQQWQWQHRAPPLHTPVPQQRKGSLDRYQSTEEFQKQSWRARLQDQASHL